MPLSRITQTSDEVSTPDATPVVSGADFGTAFDLEENTVSTVDVEARCITGDAASAKVFNVRRHIKNDGGTVTATEQEDLTGPAPIGDDDLAATVEILYAEDPAKGSVRLTGIVDPLNWRLDTQIVSLGAGALAPASFATLGLLGCTGLFLAPFGGSGWTGTDSGEDGTSDGHDLSKLGTVAVGTAIDTKEPAVYTHGTSGCHIGNFDADEAFGVDGGSIVILAKATDDPEENVPDTENNPGLVACAGVSAFQMGYSDAGLRVGTYSGGVKDAPAVPASSDKWHVFAGRFTSGVGAAVQASVDGSDFTLASILASPPSLGSNAIVIGANFGYSSGNSPSMQILAAMTFNKAISQADLTSIMELLAAPGAFPTAMGDLP